MSLAERIGGLSPFGPIFGKELRVASRRKRNHFLRVAYLGGLLLFLLLIYTGTAYRASDGSSVARRLQTQAQLGRNFFIMFSFFCLSCMGVISPILTSTAISSERLGKTLPVLLMTPITSWQIVSGKLFSRLLISLMLIGLSLPVLALVRLLGGVEAWQMIAVICIAASFAISCAAIGLFFSTRLTQAYSVILVSYGTLGVLYALAPLVAAVFFDYFRVLTNASIMWLARISNPFFNTVMVVDTRTTPFGSYSTWFWVPGVIVQLLLAALMTVASSLMLRRIARTAGESQPIASHAEQAFSSESPAQMSRGQLSAREVGNNPVLWRELRRPLITGRWPALAGVIVVALLLTSYACFAPYHALKDRDLQIGYGFIFNGLYMLLVGVLSATVIAQEKEGDTWNVLITSPLSARTMVMGKLLGVVRRMLWPTVLIVAHYAIFTIGRVISVTAFVLLIWVIVSFNSIWAATGVYLSLRVRKVTTAVIVNLMIPIVLFIAVPMALQAMGALLVRSDNWVEFVAYYLPYFYFVMTVNGLTPGYSSFEPISMPVLSGPITLSSFIVLTIVAGIVHLLLAVIVVRHTIASFDAIVGRAKQT